MAVAAKEAIGGHGYVFTDVRRMMALADAGQFMATGRVSSSREDDAASGSIDAAAAITSLGLPTCRAILVFRQGDSVRAADRFAPLDDNDAAIGAGHVQRDIINRYFIEGCIRARRLSQARRLPTKPILLLPEQMSAVGRLQIAERSCFAALCLASGSDGWGMTAYPNLVG